MASPLKDQHLNSSNVIDIDSSKDLLFKNQNINISNEQNIALRAQNLSLYQTQQKIFKESNNMVDIQKRRDSVESNVSSHIKIDLEPQQNRSRIQSANNANNSRLNNNLSIFAQDQQNISKSMLQFNQNTMLNQDQIKILSPSFQKFQNQQFNQNQQQQQQLSAGKTSIHANPSSLQQNNMLLSNANSNVNMSEHSQKMSERNRLNSRNILKKKFGDDTASQKSQKIMRSKRVTVVLNEHNADNDLTPINNNLNDIFNFSLNLDKQSNYSPTIKKRKSVKNKRVMLNIIIIAKIKSFIDKLRASVNIRSEKKLRQVHYRLINDFASHSNKKNEEEELNQNKCSYRMRIYLNLFTKFYNKIFKKCDVIDPSNAFRITMDIFQSIVICVILFSYSINICMYSDYVYNSVFRVFTICTIAAFCFDIVINFFTAFYIKGSLEKNPSKIAVHYIKSDFFYDIVSTFCLYLQNFKGLPSHFNTQTRIAQITLNDWDIILVQIGIFCKIVPLRRLYNRLSRLFTMRENSMTSVTLFKLMVFVFGLSHIVALSWIILAVLEYEYFNEKETWLHIDGLWEDQWQKQYIAAYYWAGATMMTVGTIPYTPIEQFYTTIMMFITCGVFGYVLQAIGIVLSDMSKKKEVFQNELNIINIYMRKNKIDQVTRDKVREYLEYIYIEGEDKLHNDKENEIIVKLSQTLQDDMAKQVSSNILQYFPFLAKNFSQQSLKKLIYNIEEMKFSPNETIVDQQKGLVEKDHSIYLIQKGSVKIYMKNDKYPEREAVLRILRQNSCFGQEGFFTAQPHTWTVKSNDFCTLLRISRNKFVDIIKEMDTDFQRYCEMKDRMYYNYEYNVIDLKCYACDSSNHAAINCQSTHFLAQKDRIIQKYNYSAQQRRNTVQSFVRRLRDRHYPWKIQNKCLDAINNIIENSEFFQNFKFDMDYQRKKFFQIDTDEEDEDEDDDEYNQQDDDEYDEDEDDDEEEEQDYYYNDQQVYKYPQFQRNKRKVAMFKENDEIQSSGYDRYEISHFSKGKSNPTNLYNMNSQDDNVSLFQRNRNKSLASNKSRGRINSTSYEVQRRGKSPSIDIRTVDNHQFQLHKTPSSNQDQYFHNSNLSNQGSNLDNKSNQDPISSNNQQINYFGSQQNNISNSNFNLNQKKGSTFDSSNQTQDNNLYVPQVNQVKKHKPGLFYPYQQPEDLDQPLSKYGSRGQLSELDYQTKTIKASSYQDYESNDQSQQIQTRSRGSTAHQFNRQPTANQFLGMQSPMNTFYNMANNKQSQYNKQKSNFSIHTRTAMRRLSKNFQTLSTYQKDNKDQLKLQMLDDVRIQSYQRYFPSFNIDQIVKVYKRSLKAYKYRRSVKSHISRQGSKSYLQQQSNSKIQGQGGSTIIMQKVNNFKLDQSSNQRRKPSQKLLRPINTIEDVLQNDKFNSKDEILKKN